MSLEIMLWLKKLVKTSAMFWLFIWEPTVVRHVRTEVEFGGNKFSFYVIFVFLTKAKNVAPLLPVRTRLKFDWKNWEHYDLRNWQPTTRIWKFIRNDQHTRQMWWGWKNIFRTQIFHFCLKFLTLSVSHQYKPFRLKNNKKLLFFGQESWETDKVRNIARK